MTPPLSIGSHVEKYGIMYSAPGQLGFPASSLRLVEEELKIGDYVEVQKDGCGKKKGFVFCIETIDLTKRLSEMVPYYSANKLPMWTKDELRKLTPSEIEEHLKPKLKVGDWVCRDDHVFQIVDTHAGFRETLCLNGKTNIWHSSTCLRKLAPEEVAKHTKPPTIPDEIKDINSYIDQLWIEAANGERRLSNVEKDVVRLAFHTATPTQAWMDSIEERLSAIEEHLACHDESIDGQADELGAMRKNIDVLVGEMPEVIDGNSADGMIHIRIYKGNKEARKCAKTDEEIIGFAKWALDSMREG